MINIIPKVKAPKSLKIKKKGAFPTEVPQNSNSSSINNSNNQEIYLIEGDFTVNNKINQNFNNNNIGQAGGKIYNKNTTVNTANKVNRRIDWERVYSSIDKMDQLRTGNSNVDSEISKLKVIKDKTGSKSNKEAAIIKHINNLYTMCKTAKITLPIIASLFKLFGLH